MRANKKAAKKKGWVNLYHVTN